MVASMLQERGLKTGLFTSPHLVRVNERIRIQGEPISDELLLNCLDDVERAEKRLERLPTFFETLTALAFLAFKRSGVQIAVLETGLGGRLDSTNVVTPLVTGITRIDMDHQEFLGDTLEKIAFEKAGILKPGRPTVFGSQTPIALEVLRSRAEELECPVWDAPVRIGISGRKTDLNGQRFRLSTPEMDIGQVKLPLLGAYQLENVATAVSLVEAVHQELQLDVDPSLLKAGLQKTDWAGRGQILSTEPPILLDVAHNPGGAKALAQMIPEVFGKKAKGVWVWSSLSDKEPEEFLKILRPFISQILCVELDTPRAISGDRLVDVAQGLGLTATRYSLEDAKAELPTLASQADFGAVAGSVYLAGAWLSAGAADPGEVMKQHAQQNDE
jgi:dihydrofolate synthase/folylpolyglutamate synthase